MLDITITVALFNKKPCTAVAFQSYSCHVRTVLLWISKPGFCAPLAIYLEETENGFITCFLLTYSVLTVTIFLGCCSMCQEIADPVSVLKTWYLRNCLLSEMPVRQLPWVRWTLHSRFLVMGQARARPFLVREPVCELMSVRITGKIPSHG